MRRPFANAADLAPPSARHTLAMVLTLVAAIAAGCQTFAPGSITGLATSRQEKKILKQAEVDPFPSPADVGLGAPTATP